MSKPQRQEKKEEQQAQHHAPSRELEPAAEAAPPALPHDATSSAYGDAITVATAEEVAHNLRRAAIELGYTHDGGVFGHTLLEAMNMVLACSMPRRTRAALEVMLGALDRGHGADKTAADFLRKALDLAQQAA